MSIYAKYKQISYIKARKEINLNKLLRNEINLYGYSKALNSYLRQVKELEVGKELYPNIWLEIIDLKGLLKDELTSVNKLMKEKISLNTHIGIDKNLRIRFIK